MNSGNRAGLEVQGQGAGILDSQAGSLTVSLGAGGSVL